MMQNTNEDQKRDGEQAKCLPCPFCGYKDVTIKTDYEFQWVYCNVCYSQGPAVGFNIANPGCAIKFWNERKND